MYRHTFFSYDTAENTLLTRKKNCTASLTTRMQNKNTESYKK